MDKVKVFFDTTVLLKAFLHFRELNSNNKSFEELPLYLIDTDIQRFTKVMKWEKWSKFGANESYWQNHYEKGLVKAEYIKDYTLRLCFRDDTDISIYELDFYPLIVEENPGKIMLPFKRQESL